MKFPDLEISDAAREVATQTRAREIAARIRSGDPVAFLIGSYVSTFESGFASVGSVINQIWADLKAHSSLIDVKDIWPVGDPRIQFEVYFQFYREIAGEGLSDWAAELFKGGAPGTTHGLLGRLAVDFPNVRLLTTNFDTLFEQATPGMTAAEIFAEGTDIRDKPGSIYKLHGSIDRAGSLIINMRSLARGLPNSGRLWLEERLREASFVYLGWSGVDFDIFPVVQSVGRGPGDVVTIRPQCYGESLEKYIDEHWRPVRIQQARGGHIVVDYKLFIETLAAEFGAPMTVTASSISMVVPPTPIQNMEDEKVLEFALALLEHDGEVYSGLSLAKAHQPHLPRAKSLHRHLLHQAGRFSEGGTEAKRALFSAFVHRKGLTQVTDALCDWGTMRCNQRLIWHMLSTWGASRLARRIKARHTGDVYAPEVKLRALLHWAIGQEIIADVFYRLRIPLHKIHRKIAHKLLKEANEVAHQENDQHRIFTANLEFYRSMTFSTEMTLADSLEKLTIDLRQLLQLGRGQDATVFIDRGFKVAPKTPGAERTRFAEWVVDEMIIMALRKGWAMVVVKGFRHFGSLDGCPELASFKKEVESWAFSFGEFAIWQPRQISIAEFDLQSSWDTSKKLTKEAIALRSKLIQALL